MSMLSPSTVPKTKLSLLGEVGTPSPGMVAIFTDPLGGGTSPTQMFGALKALKVLDRRLGESEWLAGDRLTIADIVAFIGIDFTRMIKLAIPEELGDLHRWAEAMRARPAAKAGMK